MIYQITEEQRQQLLDALGYEACCGDTMLNRATALLQSLAPVDAEPVAWLDVGSDFSYSKSELLGGLTDGLTPLYTNPLREVSDAEIQALLDDFMDSSDERLMQFARDVLKAARVGGV